MKYGTFMQLDAVRADMNNTIMEGRQLRIFLRVSRRSSSREIQDSLL